MKMRVVFFTCLLSLALCLPALAEMKEFAKFKIDVPAGWTTEVDGDTVGIIAPDKSAAISVTVAASEGATPEAIAKDLSEAFKGSAPEKSDDVYVFTFKNESGVDSVGVVAGLGDGKQVAVVTITGEHADVEKIVGSLEKK